MKKLALATCLISQVAFAAVTVETKGIGETEEQAVRRAKIIAIEQVTGSFNLGHRIAKNDTYNEQIDDYVSGIIIKSEIIDSHQLDGRWHTVVRSVVDETKPSTFKVEKDKPLFDERAHSKIREMNNRVDVMQKLDSKGSMLHFETKDVSISPNHITTAVTIQGTVQWQQKWVNDFENFTKVAGNINRDKKTYNSNVYTPVAFSHPVLVVGNILHNGSESQVRPGYSYCFVENRNSINTDRCHNIGYELTNFPKYNTVTTTVILKDANGSVVEQLRYTIHDVKMSEFISAGSSKKENYLFFNTSHYFKTHTSVVITDAKVPVTLNLLLNNQLASKVSSYTVQIH